STHYDVFVFYSYPISLQPSPLSFFFFFTTPAPTAIYTLSLHDALPISLGDILVLAMLLRLLAARGGKSRSLMLLTVGTVGSMSRSEEHTSEFQSLAYLVCRLLLEKKKKKKNKIKRLKRENTI